MSLRPATPEEAWEMLAKHLRMVSHTLPTHQAMSMLGVISTLAALRLPALPPRALAHADRAGLLVLCLGRHDEIEVEVAADGRCSVNITPPYVVLMSAAFTVDDVVILDHLVRQVVGNVAGLSDVSPARATQACGWLSLHGERRPVNVFSGALGTLYQMWLRASVRDVDRNDLVQIASVADVVSSKLIDLAGHDCHDITGDGDDVVPPCVAAQLTRMRSEPETFPLQCVALLEIAHGFVEPEPDDTAPAPEPDRCAPDDGRSAAGGDDDGIEEGVIEAPATWNNQIGEA